MPLSAAMINQMINRSIGQPLPIESGGNLLNASDASPSNLQVPCWQGWNQDWN
jgi:hypothetical protein